MGISHTFDGIPRRVELIRRRIVRRLALKSFHDQRI
jgi:hypothetical protein